MEAHSKCFQLEESGDMGRSHAKAKSSQQRLHVPSAERKKVKAASMTAEGLAWAVTRCGKRDEGGCHTSKCDTDQNLFNMTSSPGCSAMGR